MSEATKPAGRLQQILNDKLGVGKPTQQTSVPHAVPTPDVSVPMPAKLHGMTAKLAQELGMSHADALSMLFEKMALSVDVALDAVLGAARAKREINALTASHAKALHAANMQVSAALGQPVQVL